MLFEIISVILFISLGLSFRSLYLMLKKLEAHEDILEIQDKYLLNISSAIIKGKDHINTIDERGIFQADDEVGVFFDSIKVIQENLNQYIVEVEDAKEKI